MSRRSCHGLRAILAAAALLLLMAAAVEGAEPARNPLEGVSFEMLGYVDYSLGEKSLEGGGVEEYNRFALTRAYFTLRKKANDWLSFRVTMDVYQDEKGNYERREKYYYAEFRPGDLGFLTNLRAEVGMGHMPWLDFEEHINPYRAQGTMAVERAGLFNSADLGLSLAGYFGPRLEDAKARIGSTSYDGRWGSWHVGVYNGGGYHAPEANENKALEARVTLRPLPDVLPGLQLSWFGVQGEGNTALSESEGYPDWQVNVGMLSYQLPALTLTAQAFATEGNQKGGYVVPEDLPGRSEALETAGTSFFANWKPPVLDRRWNLFGRWDRFDVDQDDMVAEKTAYDLVIAGTAFEIYPKNLLILAFENTSYESAAPLRGAVPQDYEPARPGLEDDWKVQAVYQIAF